MSEPLKLMIDKADQWRYGKFAALQKLACWSLTPNCAVVGPAKIARSEVNAMHLHSNFYQLNQV